MDKIVKDNKKTNIKDLSLLKFGRLKPIEVINTPKGGEHAVWKCLCDCGNVINKRSNALKHTNSCGKCYSPSQDIIGNKYNMLTVVSFCRKNRDLMWNVKCDCGNMSTAATGAMTGGHKKSCGCLATVKRQTPDVKQSIKTLISTYKKGAENRKLTWNLNYYIVKKLFASNCIGCGVEPSNKFKTAGGVFKYNGIDRIDSSVGYEPGNVQTACKTCNFAKAKLTQSQFDEYLNRVRTNGLVKPFYLIRHEDVSGTSGIGIVAVGAILPSKRCILEWTTGEITETIFEDIDQIIRIHGHGGKTQVIMGSPHQVPKVEEIKPKKKVK